jgi:streptogramin lyase
MLGRVAVYDPKTQSWKERGLPGDNPMAYAVYVDENDLVWSSDLEQIHWYDLIQFRKPLIRSLCPFLRQTYDKFWVSQVK